jgi:hypothetical protein
LELLNQGLVWLADNLRTTYGEVGLLQIARLIVRASQIYTLVVFGDEIGSLASDALLSHKWPRWYPTTADDRQKDVQSLTSLVTAGCIDRATALKAIASCYDIEHVADEPTPTTPDDFQ